MQGEHAVRDEAFAFGVLLGERGELGGDLLVPPQPEQKPGALLRRRQPQRGEPLADPVAQGRVRDVREQFAPPQRQRPVVVTHPLLVAHGRRGLPHAVLEGPGVDHVPVGAEEVAVVPCLHVYAVGPEGGPQPADVGVHGGPGPGRSLAVPEQVDEPPGRHGPARLQGEDRQQTPFLTPETGEHGAAPVQGGERSEQLEFHRESIRPRPPPGPPPGAVPWARTSGSTGFGLRTQSVPTSPQLA